MISNLEEFRCPEFTLVSDQGDFLLTRPDDTIVQYLTSEEAMAKVMTRLDDPLMRPRPLPRALAAYSRASVERPLNFDKKY